MRRPRAVSLSRSPGRYRAQQRTERPASGGTRHCRGSAAPGPEPFSPLKGEKLATTCSHSQERRRGWRRGWRRGSTGVVARVPARCSGHRCSLAVPWPFPGCPLAVPWLCPGCPALPHGRSRHTRSTCATGHREPPGGGAERAAPRGRGHGCASEASRSAVHARVRVEKARGGGGRHGPGEGAAAAA